MAGSSPSLRPHVRSAGAFASPASAGAPPLALERARRDVCAPGRNCWRLARAARVAFLVDADAYFGAFAAAVARARESIFIVGWDVQGSARLQPGPMPRGWPSTLREYLNAALAARPGLDAYVLDWDFSFLFALERELLPVVQLGWLSHPRLHFRLDDEHPLTACHHQKIVVIDDAIAFVGGLDLTTSRWDTPGHRATEPARRLPNGKPYGPFHDVQIAVSGDAARALATLVRARWARATGARVPPSAPGHDPWPPDLAPDVTDVEVAIARTAPPYQGLPPTREVETLYLDMIAAARRWIYVENQYFTSPRIAGAMAARLAEANGPEIVMVGPRICSGWLEERTMGTVRARLLARLRAADRHDRFRVHHPRLAGGDDPDLNVHAKVMIVDDAIVRIGSSNLSNRSMGLDTECDVAIEPRGDAKVAAAIAAFRSRLLGEHLDVAPSDVDATLRRTGSLIATIERLGGRARTLVPITDCASTAVRLPDIAPVDLERPVAHAPFFAWLLPPRLREPVLRAAARGARALIGIAGTSLAWRAAGLGMLLGSVATPRAVGALSIAYLVGAAAQVPIAALHTVAVLALGPERGFVAALAASGATDVVVFALGALLPRHRLARIAGRHLVPVGRLLVPGRVWDVAIVRASAAAPFPTVGMIAGGSGVPLWRFLAGTLLVGAPAVVVTALVVRAIGF